LNVARRVPLPRLTHRQRTARWQRERRQQAIVVTVFTAVLVFVLGLAAWAASDRYYQANLTPAAEISGVQIPKREYQEQLRYEYVRLYQQYGVPPGFENDPQLDKVKNSYQELALDRLVEQHVLDRAAQEARVATTDLRLDEQYDIEFGEFKVRHVLISVPADATDKETAEATAKAKARAVADQLREAPMDQDLWNRIAKERSDDPGSKESGGELGFAGSGSYVAEFEQAIRSLAVGQISDPVRTQFGFHVIQLQEKRKPADTDLVKRYRSYGYSEADLRQRARYELLRKEFERRQVDALATGTVEQVRLAKIFVRVPSLTSGDFQGFTDALKKQTTVREQIDQGKDFAEIAKEQSDDPGTKEKGGEVGWIARGMIVDANAEPLVFSTEPGKTTAPISTSRDWTVYKVLEKEAAREVIEDQRTTMKQHAYRYWLARQRKVYEVRKLLPGFAID
jgi:parvulin-like peptidyl-prolyl isomerase